MSALRFGVGASLGLVCCFMAAGCMVEAGSEEDVSSVSQELFPLTSSLWKPARNASTTSLETCWVMTQAQLDSTVARRGWVKNIIESTWDDASWLNFHGWGRCTGGEDIRIRTSDETPHTSGLGTGYGEVVLNFTFANWDGINDVKKADDGSCAASAASRQNCIEQIAVHEFGHALGFAHDQNRDDFSQCADGSNPADQGSDGDLQMVGADPNSIMSYCPEGGWSGLLSVQDINQVGRMYGADGAHVRSGSSYALRNQDGRYLRLNNGVGSGQLRPNIVESDDRFNILSLTKVGGDNGEAVRYGDRVNLWDTTIGQYLCADAASVIYASSLVCPWTVAHTSGTVGGTTVDINDPFELERGNAVLSLGGENDWRFIGPIVKPQEVGPIFFP